MKKEFDARGVFKGGLVYTFVTLLQKSLSFLLLPFYARVLTPAEFGQISLIATVTSVTTTLLAFGLDSAVFRQFFVLKHDELARRTFISSIGAFALTVPVAVTCVFGAISIISARSNSTVDGFSLAVGFLSAGMMVFGSVVVLPLLRVERRIGPFIVFSGLSICTTVVLTLTFVIGFRWASFGWFLAQLAGALVALPYGLWIFRPHWTSRINGAVLKQALSFGIPLVPHQIAHWSLSIADRLILSLFVSPSLVGIYSMGYQITSVVGNVLTSVNQTLMPEYARVVSSDSKMEAPLQQSATFQIVFSAFMAVGAGSLLPPVIRLILPPEYGVAADLIPWIALGYFFFGIYYVPMNMLTLVNGDTKWNWVFTVLAGTSAAVLNLLLIPRWGIHAAAVVTACGYVMLFISILAYGQWKHGNVWPIDSRIAGNRLLVLAALAVAGLLLRPDSAWLALCVGVLVSIGAAIVAASAIIPFSRLNPFDLSVRKL